MSGKGNGRRDDSYFAAGRRRRKKYMMMIIPIVVAVIVIGTVTALLYKPPEVLAVSGVECHATEVTTYHVHSHLDIFIDGKNQTIPSQIGILSSPHCLFWLHTHDTSGLIHVEAPQQRAFTLGQFMDIWRQKFDGSKTFFDSIAGKPVKSYVNGTLVQDFRNIPLKGQEQIVLAFGTPPPKIPTYNFG